MRKRIRPGDRGTHGVWRSSLGKSFSYDSNWEKRRMITLDLNGVRFSREGVQIPYIFENTKRTYLPDFVIFNRWGVPVRIEEIKPIIRHKDPINQAKWAAARLWCAANNVEFRIIDETNIHLL